MMSATKPERDFLITWAPDGFTETLRMAARQAVFAQADIRAETKRDGTLVTIADRQSEALLSDFISRTEPRSFVIGEETVETRSAEYATAALAGRTFVVDPIDGTALYSLGLFGWGVSVGLMEQGTLKHGAVLFPDAGASFASEGRRRGVLLYSTDAGVFEAGIDLSSDAFSESAVYDARPIEVMPPIPDYAGMLAVSQSVSKYALYSGPMSVLNTASCVFSFWQLIRGAFSGYVVKVKLWDLAAVFPIAERLGIVARYQNGVRIGATLSEDTWRLDPQAKGFLSMHDQGLFYRPERCGPEVLSDLTWPGI